MPPDRESAGTRCPGASPLHRTASATAGRESVPSCATRRMSCKRTVKTPPVRKWAHNERRRAVGVDVIGPSLCIVLEDKDCRVLPDAALRNRVDESAGGQIV